MKKPRDLFDRDAEWTSIDRFVANAKQGPTLGLVYGRRRQGKTFLLQYLTEARKGFYFAALQQSDTQNLARLADVYRSFVGSRAPVQFATWDDAIHALLALGEGRKRPVPVVLDEFSYLVQGAPHLASVLQASLAPRSKASAAEWPTRLVLCGSALSTMRGLLAGTAPLRGRASLELMVHPFGYRDAAAFWKVADQPEVAARLHALVGGTAGYLDMVAGQTPTSLKTFDDWVATTLLDPASAMFREGRVLLAEEERVTDVSTYFAVLGAISQGKTRRGEIAVALGRPEGALAHPLAVLTEARLISASDDALRQRRTTFHIAEPILRLHQLVIAQEEPRLERRQARAVWRELADTVASKIYGPHLEQLCRDWCALHASADSLGGSASTVSPSVVACRSHRVGHEVDVVVVSATAGKGRAVAAIGEAKWRSEPLGRDHLARLEHIRDLIESPTAKLLLFSRGGFTRDLTTEATRRPDVELVDLDRLYGGS